MFLHFVYISFSDLIISVDRNVRMSCLVIEDIILI
jgi:hypothetical protein